MCYVLRVNRANSGIAESHLLDDEVLTLNDY